jgi:hypothetical protein
MISLIPILGVEFNASAINLQEQQWVKVQDTQIISYSQQSLLPSPIPAFLIPPQNSAIDWVQKSSHPGNIS